MNKYASQLANDAKDLNNQAQNRTNEIFNKADDKISSVANKASNVLDNAEGRAFDFAKSVASYVQKLLDENGSRVVNAKETAEDTIKTHPLTSAAVAFTGGLLVAALLGIGSRK